MSSATIALRRSTSFAAMRARAFFRIILRSEEHTSELQSQSNLVCRLLLEKKKGIPSAVVVAAIAIPFRLRALELLSASTQLTLLHRLFVAVGLFVLVTHLAADAVVPQCHT